MKLSFKLDIRYTALLMVVALLVLKGYQTVGIRLEEQTITAMAGVLKNKCIVVDPGHGGYDPGKVGATGVKEKDLNLAISLKLKEQLQKIGAKVILTREKDEDFTQEGNQNDSMKKRDLDYRIGLVRNVNPCVYINIQANSFGNRWTGAQTFYNIDNEAGRKLAIAIQEQIKNELRNTDRVAIKMSSKDSYILRSMLEIPAVIVEVGFISNAKEEQMLKDPIYQDKMAKAIMDGIIKYIGEGQQEL
jgi:N-acetylmuramoyl-L-alanine amidase